MSLESRSRTISFRLTAEEYNRFHQLCFEQGIASVSEMVRAAVHSLVEQTTRSPHQTLDRRVAELEARVQHLAREVRKLNPASSLLEPEPVRLLASS